MLFVLIYLFTFSFFPTAALFCLGNSPILAKTTPSFYFLIALAACPTTVTNSDNRDHKWGLKTVLWVGGFWVGKGGTGPMTKRTARWAINPNWLKWLGRPAIGILCHCPAVSVAFRISLHRELVYAKMLHALTMSSGWAKSPQDTLEKNRTPVNCLSA